jgi:CheY-like chemotaxis protein
VQVPVQVLLVEDHVGLANRVDEDLRDAGFAVDAVCDGTAAPESTMSADNDVVPSRARLTGRPPVPRSGRPSSPAAGMSGPVPSGRRLAARTSMRRV